jgi:hypothetical protein
MAQDFFLYVDRPPQTQPARGKGFRPWLIAWRVKAFQVMRPGFDLARIDLSPRVTLAYRCRCFSRKGPTPAFIYPAPRPTSSVLRGRKKASTHGTTGKAELGTCCFIQRAAGGY